MEWAGQVAGQSRAEQSRYSINNLAAKATFLPLNPFHFSSSLPSAVNVEIPFGCGIRQQSYFAGKGAPRAMEMSWSGISKILAAGHAGRLKSAPKGITIMDPFRS